MKVWLFILFLTVFSFSDELRSLTNRGTRAYKKGDFVTALEYFSQAAQKYPDDLSARFNLGLALGASGNVKEADGILAGLRFDDDGKNASILYTRARVREAIGDAILFSEDSEPDFAQARNAYMSAMDFYAKSLDLKRERKTINNIEILAQKIKNLPEQEPPEESDESQESQDNEDENEDNGDGEGEPQDSPQPPQPEPDEPDEQDVLEALRLIEHYADDAEELNRPPKQKAEPPTDGRDW